MVPYEVDCVFIWVSVQALSKVERAFCDNFMWGLEAQGETVRIPAKGEALRDFVMNSRVERWKSAQTHDYTIKELVRYVHRESGGKMTVNFEVKPK